MNSSEELEFGKIYRLDKNAKLFSVKNQLSFILDSKINQEIFIKLEHKIIGNDKIVFVKPFDRRYNIMFIKEYSEYFIEKGSDSWNVQVKYISKYEKENYEK